MWFPFSVPDQIAINLFPEVSHNGGFAQINCSFSELIDVDQFLLERVDMEMNSPNNRVESRMTNGLLIFSLIPVTLEDDGSQYRCTILQPGGIPFFSDAVTVRVDTSPPPTCMLLGGWEQCCRGCLPDIEHFTRFLNNFYS
jgi:hypothetical protein